MIKKIIEFIIKLFLNYGKIELEREKSNIAQKEYLNNFPVNDHINMEKKQAYAKRLKDALDYATSLVFYKAGYENINFPDIVRTYQKGQIKRSEYNTLKARGESINLVTYCNVLAFKILKGCFDYGLYDNRQDEKYNWLNYDLTCAFDMNINDIFYGLLPEKALSLLIKASSNGKVKQLEAISAQKRANCGVPILGINQGHVVIVYPNNEIYNSEKGVKVAQAGLYNASNIYISDPICWGKNWKSIGIRFFEFQYQNKEFLKYPPLEVV